MANYKLNQTGEQIQNVLNLIDSNAATSGKVLTADGNGGASWQDASGGGGTQLYAHYLHLINNTTSNEAYFTLYSPYEEQYDINSLAIEHHGIKLNLAGYAISNGEYTNFLKYVSFDDVIINVVVAAPQDSSDVFINFDTSNSTATDIVTPL